MRQILVSYRRKDSTSETGRIVEHLTEHFGKQAVFNDVFDIHGGERFRDVISQQLKRSKVVLVVIGPRWLNDTADDGKRRLEQPDDYVRFEVSSALKRSDCIVIPVLVNHQQVPSKQDLPTDIDELVDRNAVHIRPDPDFADDMEKLCDLIKNHVPSRKLWTRRALLGGLAATTVATGCWYLLKQPSIKIGIKQWVGYAPLVVASKMGLCRGLTISFETVEEIHEVPLKLLERRIDAGMWLSATHVVNRSNKIPAKMILKLDDSYYEDGIVARDFVTTFEELRNQKVIYQHYDAGHCMLLSLCRQHGVEFSQLDVKHVPSKDVPDYFNSHPGYLAATTYEDHLSEALKIPGTRLFGRAMDFNMGDFGIVDALVVHESYLGSHDEEVASLIEGWYSAVELLRQEDSDAIRIACDFMGQKPTKDPVVFTPPKPDKDLKLMIRDDHVKLAGKKENYEFFKRDQDGDSQFRRQYEYFKDVWTNTLGAGATEFELADGSREFIHLHRP